MPGHLRSILIVDHSAVTRTVIKHTLGMAGLDIGQVHEAADGRAAMMMLLTKPVDLVLAKLNMPVMDGFGLIQQMRQNPRLRLIPVVLTLAEPNEDGAEQLKITGVVGYLVKPFRLEAVRELIGSLLGAEKDAAVGV